MSIGLGRTVLIKFTFRKAVSDNVRSNVLSRAELFRSVCPKGYRMKDNVCTDINECESAREICHHKSSCINTAGDYLCERTCPTGYKSGLQGDCEDIDECELGMHNCKAGSRCINKQGGFSCDASLCAEGFTRDSNGYCKDVNECEELPCGELECVNYIGSYICLCPTGFFVSSEEHCAEQSQIWTSSKTIKFNENSSICPEGYHHSDGFCKDINECVYDFPCKYKCQNTEGGYQCLCPEGYEVEDNDCKDIDECLYDPCSEEELCFNHLGSYECLSTPCPTDFHREGLSCVPNCVNCSHIPMQIHLISVPRDVPAETLLLDSTLHEYTTKSPNRTRYIVRPVSRFLRYTRFSFTVENGRIMLRNTESLHESGTYKLVIRSISKLPSNVDKIQCELIVFIAISEYDF
ncbi:unnamed protein product [Thelazia callipaeda]|uniref:Fibulin-1 n=1 Tax=Thelazia callipaeda TaxID=103827 RepID=A0A0N5CZ78_THECL|nr:unnamed protein product [Thelazia callipaeda]